MWETKKPISQEHSVVGSTSALLSMRATNSAERSLRSCTCISRMWCSGTSPTEMRGTDRRDAGTVASYVTKPTVPSCSRMAAGSVACLAPPFSATIHDDASSGSPGCCGCPYQPAPSCHSPCSRSLISFHGSSCRRIHVACTAKGATPAARHSCSTSCVSVLQNCAAGRTAPVTFPLVSPHRRPPVPSSTRKSGCGHLKSR
mmetsp:Transcript_74/g.259  ORF Transcript_74/g.259 Transcript_74/m.259 type:complete len:201 (-) Transcript_74:647-1249(-)